MQGFILCLTLLVSACASMPSRGSTQNTTAQVEACVVGEGIPYGQETFSIDHVLVEYGPGVTNIMARVQKEKGSSVIYADYSHPLYVAANAGAVERFRGETPQRIYVHNVPDTAQVPDMLPYKSGRGRCAGVAAVKRLGPHTLEVTFPLRGGSGFGQGGVVFPRGAINARNLVVCTTSEVDLLFVPELTKGPLRGLPNTLCAQGTVVGERVTAGKPAILFGMVAATRARHLQE